MEGMVHVLISGHCAVLLHVLVVSLIVMARLNVIMNLSPLFLCSHLFHSVLCMCILSIVFFYIASALMLTCKVGLFCIELKLAHGNTL